MKRELLVVVILVVGASIVVADQWNVPGGRDYYSENGMYSLQVIPSGENFFSDSARVGVCQVQINQFKYYQWHCDLGFEGSPIRCYVTNDGQTVITVDQINVKKHGGYGDHILAFYNKDGVIKNYCLVGLLGLPEETDFKELQLKMPMYRSSLRWDQESIEFLDEVAGVEYFCMWLPLVEKWLAWEVETGKSVDVTEKMESKWIEKARKKILRYTKDGLNNSIYLGHLKRKEDRKLIEKALGFKKYSGISSGSGNKELKMYGAGSSERTTAEQILAAWDQGKNIYEVRGIKMSSGSKRVRVDLPYQLGRVEGVVELPELENPRKAVLYIWLVEEDGKAAEQPFYKISIGFDNCSFEDFGLGFTRKFPFQFGNVTPGKYRIKVLLERTEPLPNSRYSNYIDVPPAEKGDYVNGDVYDVSVVKGKVAKDITISCKKLVK